MGKKDLKGPVLGGSGGYYSGQSAGGRGIYTARRRINACTGKADVAVRVNVTGGLMSIKVRGGRARA